LRNRKKKKIFGIQEEHAFFQQLFPTKLDLTAAAPLLARNFLFLGGFEMHIW
jgi:hypothetical protein